jgi:uncharacterized phage-associated protein
MCATVFDVAKYILKKTGSITTMKLQKLVYYSQAWSLVWDEKPLFSEKIEAWSNGPVVRELFERHRGSFKISASKLCQGDARRLKKEEKETIDGVLSYYADKPSQWLSDLTHAEDPWREARAGLPAMIRGANEITLESMARYYGSLPANS